MILFLTLIFFHIQLSALTITASFFNTNYSAENPLVLTENTIIELDEDITFTTTDSLFLLQNAAQPISLTFTQNNTHEFRVFVTSNAVFNTSAFASRDQQITFEKTNLVLQDTGIILLNGGKLAFFQEGTIASSH
jgi:hypothetical protein